MTQSQDKTAKGIILDVHIIAIAGGSCSGKTRLANHTQAVLGDKVSTIFRQDNYYLDYGGVDPEGPLPNFDHPMAFDWEFLRDQLLMLKSGKVINIPTYDFVTHRRTGVTERIEPKPIVLIEGILLLSQEKLLPVFDQSFFVECDGETRLARRLKRDVAERGRTPESVHAQFAEHVAPMHDQFVEPSKQYADVIVTQDQCGLDVIENTGPLISYCRGLL